MMKIEAHGVRFLDSYNFMPMPLSAMPKCYGFQHLANKGHFPFLFNRPENYDYKGEYPPPDAYGVGGMKPKAREEFLKWHAEQQGKVSLEVPLISAAVPSTFYCEIYSMFICVSF